MSIKIAVNTMMNSEDFLAQGAAAALKKLYDCGARCIELSQHIRFDETTLPDFQKARESQGMEICALSVRYSGSIPCPVPELTYQGQVLKTCDAQTDFWQVVNLCRSLGCRYVRLAGFPGAQMREEEEVRTYMAGVEEMASRYVEQGIGFCVHNHADEFMKVSGRTLLDWAMELAPHLQMELDVLNAQRCGLNPVSLLQRYAGRVPLLHVQDLAVYPNDSGQWMQPEYRGVPVGQGNMDMPEICRSAMVAGSEYLIAEQSVFYGADPYECIQVSMEAMRKYCGL